MWIRKKIWSEKKFGRKKFGSKKNFDLKKNVGRKKMWVRKKIANYRGKVIDSPLWKHAKLVHNGNLQLSFSMKVVKSFKDPLTPHTPGQ